MSKTDDKLAFIIATLADGQFHSGADLGRNLGISRAAIHQLVHQLETLGLDIYSVPGRGYRLARGFTVLDQSSIADLLGTDGQQFELERIVTSTNDVLKERIRSQQLQSGYVVVAEAQTAGRGRRGRIWQSPFGAHLYLSMYWRLERGMSAAMGLSIAVGVAVAELLQQQGIAGVELKWPNDILIHKAKLAGILVELEGQAAAGADVVIGLGLNVAMPDSVADKIEQDWTDLSQLLGSSVDRNFWVAALIKAIRDCLVLFEQEGIAPFIQRWNRFDAFLGQPVQLKLGEHQVIRGMVLGIDESGALLLRRDGITERFHAGEVSLRHDN
ncbi:bifunctional biotin--[acetyl-CoA-carboxylase] ligase/biotin operon repressor BirA [Pseudidiomarina taiwanensis]|uniref:Bifunctional ligase/repressor BirA n=1 Tax=Pseudidiomarina taiwanensis TaxID=337250 RepID=A0A432ZM45_9GAMM|nr:bifunctional biotin--[acetyl-CoA-carboxylase] ligase/biotin operon repressor BirA [Pseudidiomarina taiwanensis]RUO78951.1 bifunctional biotin--[acetyl-CoA-carboxylase] synthetase/biotin operon repressor [Pseudidiomarina taiwanensis]